MDYSFQFEKSMAGFGTCNPESFYVAAPQDVRLRTESSTDGVAYNQSINQSLDEDGIEDSIFYHEYNDKVNSSPRSAQDRGDGVYSSSSEGFLTPPPTPMHPVSMQTLMFQNQYPSFQEPMREYNTGCEEGLQEVPDAYNYEQRHFHENPTFDNVNSRHNRSFSAYDNENLKVDNDTITYKDSFKYTCDKNIENEMYDAPNRHIFMNQNYNENEQYYPKQNQYTPKYIDGFNPEIYHYNESKFKRFSAGCSGNRVSMKSRIIYTHPSLKSDFNLSQATHNVLERQRRNDLKFRFSILRNHIPELAKHDKAPKIQILTKAYKYIRQLHSLEQKLIADKELEKQRKVVLMRCVNSFKSS